MVKDIPIEIQCGLQKVGGTKGLRKILRNRKEINKMVAHGYAISDEIRVRILILLRSQDLCVCVIKSVLNISDSKLSYHLSVLNDCGLIKKRREKKFNIYKITPVGRKMTSQYKD